MFPTEQDRDECYDLLGAGDTVYEGHRFHAGRKLWAGDQVMEAFAELSMTGEPDASSVKTRVRENLERGRQFGAQQYESIIISMMIMALIEWAIEKLIAWMISKRAKPQT